MLPLAELDDIDVIARGQGKSGRADAGYALAALLVAIAVMGLAEDEGQGGGTRAPLAELKALPAEAESGGNRSNRAGVNFPRA